MKFKLPRLKMSCHACVQGQSAASGPVQPGGSNLVADFGADCPIGITRHLTLTLSNHTALQAPVQLWVDRFKASNNGEALSV